LAVLGLTLAACGSRSPAIPESKLSKLVLQQSDLPAGFGPFYVGRQLRADQTATRNDPKRFGREGGWIARYRRGGSPRTAGPLVVASRADLFGDTGGAKRDFGLYQDELGRGAFKPVRVSGLGDAAVAATSLQGAGGLMVRSYSIAWRRDNATAELDANGFARRFTLASALALARKQDARLRAAAR
jgi:hypothetical protein